MQKTGVLLSTTRHEGEVGRGNNFGANPRKLRVDGVFQRVILNFLFVFFFVVPAKIGPIRPDNDVIGRKNYNFRNKPGSDGVRCF